MLNEIVRLGSFGLLGGESSTARRIIQTCLANEFYTATALGMSYFRQAKPSQAS
jgi:hypothetical protein